MNNRFTIAEEEKNRIRGLHLSEVTNPGTMIIKERESIGGTVPQLFDALKAYFPFLDGDDKIKVVDCPDSEYKQHLYIGYLTDDGKWVNYTDANCGMVSEGGMFIASDGYKYIQGGGGLRSEGDAYDVTGVNKIVKNYYGDPGRMMPKIPQLWTKDNKPERFTYEGNIPMNVRTGRMGGEVWTDETLKLIGADEVFFGKTGKEAKAIAMGESTEVTREYCITLIKDTFDKIKDGDGKIRYDKGVQFNLKKCFVQHEDLTKKRKSRKVTEFFNK